MKYTTQRNNNYCDYNNTYYPRSDFEAAETATGRDPIPQPTGFNRRLQKMGCVLHTFRMQLQLKPLWHACAYHRRRFRVRHGEILGKKIDHKVFEIELTKFSISLYNKVEIDKSRKKLIHHSTKIPKLKDKNAKYFIRMNEFSVRQKLLVTKVASQ
jgi:hypothetical protein